MSESREASTQNLRGAIAHALKLLKDGQLQMAEEQAREILKSYPDEPNSLRTLGLILRRQQRLGEAQPVLERAIAGAPGFAHAHQDLGLVHLALGHPFKARVSLEKAVALDASLVTSWAALGEIHLAAGDEEQANAAFRQQLRTASRDPALVRAVELFEAKKIAQAEAACRDYLKRKPTDVSAIRLLAEIGLRLKIYDEAEKLLKRCLELAPDYHLARLNYASALSGRQRPAEALEQLDTLEELDPGKPAQLVQRAAVLAQMGRYEESIECYETLDKKHAPQAKISLSYGHALKTIGRQEEAIAAYRRSVSLDPGLGEAYWSLANLKTYRFSDEDFALMEAQADDKTMRREDFFHLCFALGKGYEDREQYEKAFHFYRLGNQVKDRQEGYSPATNRDEIERTIAVSTPELFLRHGGDGCQRPDPIFIVGLPRSGSTLLEQILASHSQVDGTKELPDIIAIARKLGGRHRKDERSAYPEVLARLDAEQLLQLGEEYLQRAAVQRGDAPFFIDKMPNNFAHLGLIRLILPQAKVIDARRHPMAACFSGYKQLFASGQRFSYSLDSIGRYYRDYVELMAHWQQVIPGWVHTVHYEDVVADLPGQVRAILEHCDLPFEQACIAFHETERAVRTASSEQVRQPIYVSGLEQWRHFEPWLGDLEAALGPALESYR